MLVEVLSGLAAGSSVSSGVGSGGGNWMLLRSGSEPPVLWAAGMREADNSWSGDGNILGKWRDKNIVNSTDNNRQHAHILQLNIEIIKLYNYIIPLYLKKM